MDAQVWFEVLGYHVPMVSRRLVSSETACYVFHPNGRKSRKADDRGNIDWHKTFADAKAEIVRRANVRIEVLQSQLMREIEKLQQAQALEESNVKAESNIASAVAV